MPNITAKTSSNVFYQSRCRASAHNEQLCSREGAADIMAIDRGRLYRIENGIATPYPEEIKLMADLYNAPELVNYYCTTLCPLGSEIPKAEIADLDRITVKALSSLKRIEETRDLLLEVAEDGKVSDEERSDMAKVMENLEELEKVTQNLRLWVKKNMKEVTNEPVSETGLSPVAGKGQGRNEAAGIGVFVRKDGGAKWQK